MGLLNDDLELKTQIVEKLLDDLARLYSFPVTLDKAYVRNRALSEGTSFFTKTLPAMGKVFDEWMKDETRDLYFEGFNSSFLKGLKGIIAKGDREPDRVSAIRGLRQLCFMYYKLESLPTEAQMANAIQSFKEVDLELAIHDIPWYQPWFELAKRLIAQLIAEDEFDSFKQTVNPRHGPGSVASGEKGSEKWNFKRINPLVGHVLDYREMYHLPPFSSICSESTIMEKDLIIDPYPTSKLVAVPKDSRGPRLICEEPLEIQYLQQWVFRIFDKIIEGSKFRGELSMRDQSRNQTLAAEGSYTSQWCTLDLKEASDRVSLPLVLSLFPDWLHPWFRALRSTRVNLPNGQVFPTVKFAPMGSALCFPVESITFWALSRAVCILNGCCNRLPCPTASVFGDDIIVPNEMFGPVCEALELCGLVVNRAKSYHSGNFRESCGVDAYSGIDVTPVRFKKEFPSSWRDASCLSNYVAVINGLRSRSFDLVADFIQKKLLCVAPLLASNNIGSLSLSDGPKGRRRWNKNYQRAEVYTYRISPRMIPFPENHLRLRRSVISPVVEGKPDKYTPPHQVRVEKGWTPIA